jgi:hypothetical protein
MNWHTFGGGIVLLFVGSAEIYIKFLKGLPNPYGSVNEENFGLGCLLAGIIMVLFSLLSWAVIGTINKRKDKGSDDAHR